MATQSEIDSRALERSLAVLREGCQRQELADALREVLSATRALFGATGAGVMIIDESSALAAVLATDDPGWLLERRQQETGEGPCVEALAIDRIVSCEDLACDERWPKLGEELSRHGIRGVLGVPLHVDGIPVGSLNVYRDSRCSWSEAEVDALEAYAGLIGNVLSSALQAREQEQLAGQLQRALDNRVVIDRAVGLLMGRERIDAVTAFNQLRRLARSSERKVAVVATELLDAVAR